MPCSRFPPAWAGWRQAPRSREIKLRLALALPAVFGGLLLCLDLVRWALVALAWG